jgi:tetratricopeptide (TPR) repeat protein
MERRTVNLGTRDNTLARWGRRLMPTVRMVLAGLGVGLMGLMGGCASSQPQVSPAYVGSYNAGQFQAAYRDAVTQAREDPSGERPLVGSNERARAALVAGLAAHAMGRDTEAERWLNPLVEYGDTSIAGRAGAALGLIASSRGEYESAATLLVAAAGKLNGDESARANFYAGEALSALGRDGQARVQYALASASARQDSPLRRRIEQRISTGRYSIQLGAFSKRTHAQAVVDSVRTRAQELGVGPPKIILSTDKRNRRLYVVRVGKFHDRAAALDTLHRLSVDGFVMATPATPVKTTEVPISLPFE